jgi:hypothetical protein
VREAAAERGTVTTSAATRALGGLRDADTLLLVGSAVGLLAVASFLLSDGFRGPRPRRGAEPTVARLARAEPGVLRRPSGTLIWDPAHAGEQLSVRDSLYVPPAASASVSFDGGALLEIEERSLVVIEPPEPEPGAARLKLAKGSLSSSVPAGRVSVHTPGGLAVLEPGSEARVGARDASGPRVEVALGSARAENGEVVRVESLVRVDQPARNQRFWFTRFPASVHLSWDGAAAEGARLEIARDPGFSDLVDHAPGAPGAHAFQLAAPGAYFWRLVDQDRNRRSEVRRLLAVKDRPPKPYSPMAAEIVLAAPGVQVPFWWTAVDGASRYQLELSTDASFATVVFSADAEGPGLWAALHLPEGVYFWRVRASAAERVDAPFSHPSPFRLIHRPLPEAPQLFDPSIEVVHGDAR